MMRVLLLLLVLSTFLGGSEVMLKQRFCQAKNGDYIVTESNQTFTILAIRSMTPRSLILEEITAPLKKRPSSWSEWVKAKAPGHSSWSMMEIDLQSGEVLECYSFSRSAWVQFAPSENLVASLLQLPLHSVDSKQRRRIGPPPGDGESDVRKIWHPPLVFEGKTLSKVTFDAFEAKWPADGSELAEKVITLYFDRELQFPLPYWIQVDLSHATSHVRAIDSGHNLFSLHRTMPRRIPQFMGLPKKTAKGLVLFVKSPKYFRDFELFAIDVTGKEKQIFPMTHVVVEGEGELLTLEIAESDLQQTLQSEHRYTWLLVPSGHSESYTEMTKPFMWVGAR